MEQKLFRKKFFRKECQPILIDRASGTFGHALVDRKKIKKMREVIKILKQLGRECITELIGTLILCGFGNASIAVFILAPQNLSSSLSVHFSWGLGACFGCYVSKSISGGHINPAVTVMKTVFGQFPIYKMIPFIISQTIGAFLSS